MSLKSIAAVAAISSVMVCATIIPAIATPIPGFGNVQLSSTCGVNIISNSVNGAGTCTASGITSPASVVTVNVVGAGTMSGIDNHLQGGGGIDFGTGRIVYDFQVSGPVSGRIIPMGITLSLHSNATMTQPYPFSAASASAAVGVDGGFGFQQLMRVCAGINQNGSTLGCGGITDFTGTLQFSAFSGYLGSANLFIGMNTAGGGTSASASVDPYIFIDPTFLANNPGYTLLVASGINNSPPGPPAGVPEPSTLILLGAGLAGFTTMRRARKAKA